MKAAVAAFFVEVAGKPSRLDEYLAYARASATALRLTTPGATYTLLTDRATAPKLAGCGLDVDVLVPERPLMMAGIEAQIAFLRKTDADLIVLPDVDCIANKDLRAAIPTDVALAITHKGAKFRYKINNLAYIRDRGLGVWFLSEALAILERWPEDRHDWWGDQEAWGAVIGLPIPEEEPIEAPPGEILKVITPRGAVHVYPNVTHNCPMSGHGGLRQVHRHAQMIHFKGDRKEHLARFMNERFGT